MQVEAGKFYLRRDGEVAGPMGTTPYNDIAEHFPFWCPKHELTYTGSGKWVFVEQNRRDLITECDKDGNPIEPEAPVTEFQPGTWWAVGNGDRVYCVGTNADGEPVLQHEDGDYFAMDDQRSWCMTISEGPMKLLLGCTGWDWEPKPEPEPEASIENLIAWLKERQRDWECQRTGYCDNYSNGYADGSANMCGHVLRWIENNPLIEPKETP